MTELDLRETLQRHLDAVDVPPAPLGPVVIKGRRRHRRRRAVAGTSVTAVLAVVAVSGAGLLLSDDGGRGVDTSQYASLGPLDFSHGARAYADPGRELHLAGRAFPYGDLDYLDTDAVATPYGMVFFDEGRPMLLGSDGEVRALVDGPLDDAEGFHPTAKLDSKHPWVAYATRRDGATTLTVRDLETGADVASTTVGCGSCTDLVIDAFDNGTVYVQIDQLSESWNLATDRWLPLSEAGTRIVDVRNGVILYAGKRPNPWPPDARGPFINMIKAPTDATLTFSGRYVLDSSSRLRSTNGGPDLVLDQGPADDKGGPAFWAIDSDGSVLVARPDGDYPHYLVYDCEVASGACEELGPLVTKSGDPMFIGADM
jgi:hypothetical protein